MIGSMHNGGAPNGAPQAPGGLRFEADLSLRRLSPRLAGYWEAAGVPEKLRHECEVRLHEHWPQLFSLLYELYGSRYDFFYHLEQILLTAARAWAERSESLRKVDRHRVNEPD